MCGLKKTNATLTLRSDVAVWSVMEPSLGIIAGCAACLRPLFKVWGFGPNSSRRYHYGQYQRHDAKNDGSHRAGSVWKASDHVHMRRFDDGFQTSRTLSDAADNTSDIELNPSLTERSRENAEVPGTWREGPVSDGRQINVKTSVDVSFRRTITADEAFSPGRNSTSVVAPAAARMA